MILAGLGLFVASVESQAMAASILGGQVSLRPVTDAGCPGEVADGLLARGRRARSSSASRSRSRRSIVDAIFVAAFGPQTDLSFVTSVLVAALVGAPLAYVLAGIVLGDVPPFDGRPTVVPRLRRPQGRGRPRRGLPVDRDPARAPGRIRRPRLALRVFDALGLGTDSGPAGLILIVIGIVVGVFALGTLIYTALAISLAPQVVMFVGLTRATFGLDHVRPGGGSDPLIARPGRRRFRWLTRPMLAGFGVGLLGLVAFVASVRS